MILAWAHQWLVFPKNMPPVSLIPKALIQGTIASIPLKDKNKTQFTFDLEQLDGHPVQGLIQLAWYQGAPPLHVGQHWQFNAKIKKPRNFHNPGSSDYVTTLNTRHIAWTGYILPQGNRRIPETTRAYKWLGLREQIANQLNKLAPNQRTAGIVGALSLNLAQHISQQDWELFRRTGTTHLFGISGEHIALISGLFTLIFRWLWSRSSSCCLKAPAPAIGSLGGFLIALSYALLAGFAPPVQRALAGCFFYALYCLGRQPLTPWQKWRYALFCVLCIEPHVVFMQGFYFSFLAAVCLLLTQQRWKLRGYKSNLALQLSCLIGLMPLSLYWFSYGSLNGFIANLFAIPLVGLLIVPLTLLTMLASPFSWAWLLMKPLSWLIELLFQGLLWTEHLAVINITWSIHLPYYVFLFLGALLLWVLLPIKPFRYIAPLWLLIPLAPSGTKIPAGQALIQVLDVGQGLAVSIRTQHHVLLYDTGDSFFQGSDLGTMVIIPFYKSMDINKIDTIVISHPDKDHRGGLKSIQTQMEVGELIVNNPAYYPRTAALNCHHHPQWQWDGVLFRFFPIRNSFRDKNNTSCILQVSNASGRVLFTGDIEKRAEDYLVRTYGEELASDILIVPHHGSKTSSSYRFLLEVKPQYAIASLGFNNRFHFPHEHTLVNMKSLGIPFIRTDDCGMVEIWLYEKGNMGKPKCYV